MSTRTSVSTYCSVCLREVEKDREKAARHTRIDTGQHCPGSGRPVMYTLGDLDPEARNEATRRREKGSDKSVHFFARDADGSTRVRLRFTAEEASLYEEAAGSVPLMHWIHQSLNKVAHEEVAAARASRPKVRPQ